MAIFGGKWMDKKLELRICMHPASVLDDDNQFITLLVDSLETQGVEIVDFSWKTALFAKYDIMHIHWPEYLISSSKNVFTLIKGLMVILLIFKLRMRNIPLVWTVHNTEPHAKNKSYYFIRKFFINRDSFKVYMQKSFPSGFRNSYIPHGNYIELFKQRETKVIQEKSLAVSFGYVRPYKNIENLMKNFPEHLGALVIAGQPITPDYGLHLKHYLSKCQASSDIRLDLKQFSGEEMLDLVKSAEIAILPYKEIYNSGAVLLALSAPIPAIVTDSPSMRDLQAEVGNDWLQIIPVEFNSLDLQNAFNSLKFFQLTRGESSPLSGLRNWELIAKRYLQIYKNASR